MEYPLPQISADFRRGAGRQETSRNSGRHHQYGQPKHHTAFSQQILRLHRSDIYTQYLIFRPYSANCHLRQHGIAHVTIGWIAFIKHHVHIFQYLSFIKFPVLQFPCLFQFFFPGLQFHTFRWWQNHMHRHRRFHRIFQPFSCFLIHIRQPVKSICIPYKPTLRICKFIGIANQLLFLIPICEKEHIFHRFFPHILRHPVFYTALPNAHIYDIRRIFRQCQITIGLQNQQPYDGTHCPLGVF